MLEENLKLHGAHGIFISTYSNAFEGILFLKQYNLGQILSVFYERFIIIQLQD